MTSVYWVLFLPLAMALVNRLWGGKLTRAMSGVLSSLAVGLALLFSLYAFSRVADLPLSDQGSRQIFGTLYSWISVGGVNLGFSLLLDPLSALMASLVAGVGLLIHVYSIAYMGGEDEGEFSRYFAYLNFFVFSMLVLVMAGSFLVMFLGWELVGVSSYLLIGFYRGRESAVKAGVKAFLVNRVGDFGFLLGILALLVNYHTLDFPAILGNPGLLAGRGALATVVPLLLFAGAVGKSAQVPLHVWLPDAMEGPTPVSALMHAATMVAAGVFMVLRCHALFQASPAAMATVAWTGVATAFLAASIALVQTDIKRVLAYSTISQLGYMMLGAGVGAYTAAFFHLFTHAFFKSLLFLGAGSVMHAMGGELDMTRMGGLKARMPVTYWTFLAGALCLAGFPLTSGFFSKDEILRQALVSPGGSPWLWLAGTLTAVLTAVYAFRLVFKVFHGETRMEKDAWDHVHESPAAMTLPMVLLAAAALLAGLLGLPESWTRFQPFRDWMAPAFFDLPAGLMPAAQAAAQAVPDWALLLLASAIALGGLAFCWRVFARHSDLPSRLMESPAARGVHALLWNKYYFDEAYQAVFVDGFRGLCRLVWRFVDEGIIANLVDLAGSMAEAAGSTLTLLQTGYVRFYLGAFVLGVVLILAMLAGLI